MSKHSAELWSLPRSLQTLVENELEDGESIDWIGQPIVGRYGIRALPIVLFAVPWTAFALFWMAGAAGFKFPDFGNGIGPELLFPLFGLPFVLMGVGMLSAPYWMMRSARRTVYVITDRRAIVFLGSKGGRSTTIRSFAPSELGAITRNQRADGSGDVVFCRDASYSSNNGNHRVDIGFLAIPEVKNVEELVRRMVASANRVRELQGREYEE